MVITYGYYKSSSSDYYANEITVATDVRNKNTVACNGTGTYGKVEMGGVYFFIEPCNVYSFSKINTRLLAILHYTVTSRNDLKYSEIAQNSSTSVPRHTFRVVRLSGGACFLLVLP